MRFPTARDHRDRRSSPRRGTTARDQIGTPRLPLNPGRRFITRARPHGRRFPPAGRQTLTGAPRGRRRNCRPRNRRPRSTAVIAVPSRRPPIVSNRHRPRPRPRERGAPPRGTGGAGGLPIRPWIRWTARPTRATTARSRRPVPRPRRAIPGHRTPTDIRHPRRESRPLPPPTPTAVRVHRTPTDNQHPRRERSTLAPPRETPVRIRRRPTRAPPAQTPVRFRRPPTDNPESPTRGCRRGIFRPHPLADARPFPVIHATRIPRRGTPQDADQARDDELPVKARAQYLRHIVRGRGSHRKVQDLSTGDCPMICEPIHFVS
jgi:hypothetical protein